MEELQGPEGGGDSLLNLAVGLYDLLQRKDTSMGDLLQTMESKKGLEKRTEEQSDEVVSMQGEADEMFRSLIRGIRKVGSGGVVSNAEDDGQGGDEEVEELQARLSNVTAREKERVEGLQAQLEMMRVELRECRKQRSMDQSIIAAADSQTTQLKASLRMTQEDAESLRGTLEQELARGHALQGRVNQLEGDVRAAKAKGRADQGEVARLQALVDGLGQRQMGEGPPLKVSQRPSSAGRARGGGEGAVVAVAVEGGGGDEELSERAVYEAYVEARKQELLQGQAARRDSDGELGGGDANNKDVHRIPTATADAAPGDYSSEGGSASASVSRTALRQPVGGRNHPSGAPKRPGGGSAQPLEGTGSEGGGASFMAPVGASRRARQPDTTTLDYLVSRVRMGHITKSSPLQLALEFCGKSSFSLRHNEEKYNLLAEQMVGLAYQHLRDRWITVLKNAEPIDNKGTTKQPRLGSFEVELLWTDANDEPRRTLLHSKLRTRVFPSVARIVQDLTQALNSPTDDGDRDEMGG